MIFLYNLSISCSLSLKSAKVFFSYSICLINCLIYFVLPANVVNSNGLLLYAEINFSCNLMAYPIYLDINVVLLVCSKYKVLNF